MNEKAENLLNELVSKIRTKEEFEQVQKQLFKRGIEALLSAELTAHIGYEKGSKPNFQLHYFYSETENGIKTQIWCTLIAQLLLQVLRVRSESKKAFSTIAALVRIHLVSHLDVFWMVQNCRRTYIRQKKRKKPPSLQTAMF